MVRLDGRFLNSFVSEDEIKAFEPKLKEAHGKIKNKTGEGGDFLGWYTLPYDYDKDEFERIKKAAEKIKKSCQVFVVIGIGGSYLGARAAIEFIKSPNYNLLSKDTPNIYFAGNSISASSLSDVLELCKGKDVCVNVISKSGTTTEPAIAFRVFKELLEEKYGKEGARERIFVTTDKSRGALKGLAGKEGYETFVIPDDIGGRYSVLTPCGLLPIAVAGIDIDKIMAGAKLAAEKFSVCDIDKNDAYRYAVIRNVLYSKGKKSEFLACYEPSFRYMTEWWKQLFGESEGKDQKGIFPSAVIYSTDLHSLGQIVQQGERTIFETVIDIKNAGAPFVIPFDKENADGLNFLAGKDLAEANRKAFLATVLAHSDGNVPNIIIEADSNKEDCYGFMVYFFELACAASGYILGVNPFNQPGVEAYKKNMFALLGKPGEENERKKAELEARLS
ncbi:MAG: glucose-6-phosphate isomerase [Clostridia bacterium]|nr:glucose-6-phosphate isomerase [Clostridia bacterium]